MYSLRKKLQKGEHNMRMHLLLTFLQITRTTLHNTQFENGLVFVLCFLKFLFISLFNVIHTRWSSCLRGVALRPRHLRMLHKN